MHVQNGPVFSRFCRIYDEKYFAMGGGGVSKGSKTRNVKAEMPCKVFFLTNPKQNSTSLIPA